MKSNLMSTLLVLAVVAGCATPPPAPDRPLRELLPYSHSTGPLPSDLSKNDRTIVAAMRISAARIAAEKKAQGR